MSTTLDQISIEIDELKFENDDLKRRLEEKTEELETLKQAYADDLEDTIDLLIEMRRKMKGLEEYVGKHAR